jgi:hypothetical protein
MKKSTRREAFRQAATAGALALGAVTAATTAAQEAGDKKARPPDTGTPPAPGKPAAARGPRELFAVVDEAGNLLRGQAASIRRINVGLYEVTFRRDIRQGVCLATIASHSAKEMPPTGYIGVRAGAGNPGTVVVSTCNTLGENVNMGFNLLVICPEGSA